MKRLFCAFLALALLLSGCAQKAPVPEAVPPSAEPSAPVSEPEPIPEPEPAPEPEPIPEPEPEPVSKGSIRVLAIGNSFSSDCTRYLWAMLKFAGYDEVVVGNLYYPGCSLQTHLSYAQKNAAEYIYYKNSSYSWVTNENYTFAGALQDEPWDIITFQQASGLSGQADSYTPYLEQLLDFVSERVSPDVQYVWNMTWAYQADSTHASFPKYGRNQMTMYNGIIDCVNGPVAAEARITGLIPTGTAIQNARTSLLGDTLTRDGYHLNYEEGRYIAALCWCAALTGISPEEIKYNPDPTNISPLSVKAAAESVANALACPFSVTKSEITVEGERPEKPAEFSGKDAAAATANGMDLSGCTLLEWTARNDCYWYSTNQSGLSSPAAGTSTSECYVCSDRKYSIREIPAGSIFLCDSGWKFRLEIFPDLTGLNTGTRPATISDAFFLLTDDYLNGCTYVAWNVSSDPGGKLTGKYDEAATHLRIYVPKK